jgi:hypothetical protein
MSIIFTGRGYQVTGRTVLLAGKECGAGFCSSSSGKALRHWGEITSAKGHEPFLKHFADARSVIISMDNFSLFSDDPREFLATL